MAADATTRAMRLGRAATTPVELAQRTAEEDAVEVLTRQLRRVTERNIQQFDLGFQAAIAMVEAGADVERLREASGVVAVENYDTQPGDLFEDEPTLVDAEAPDIEDRFGQYLDEHETVITDVGLP